MLQTAPNFCGAEIQQPPANADLSPPGAKPGASIRTFSEVRVNNPSCGGCHAAIEPPVWGLVRYDGVGAYSETDELGNPLATDGYIEFSSRATRPRTHYESHEGVSMKIAKPMNRRTLLRGAGNVAIGLRLLDAMHTRSAFAQPSEGPARAFNLSFGLGLYPDMQRDVLSGNFNFGAANELEPLEALRPLRDKLLIMRGISFRMGDQPGGANSHLEQTAFTGTRGTVNAAGGPSLDQVLRVHANPRGLPRGMLSAVHGGLAYEWEQSSRFNRCWNADGSVAGTFDHRADRFFERIFGNAMAAVPPAADANEEAARQACRRRKSILDAVVGQYRHFMSDA